MAGAIVLVGGGTSDQNRIRGTQEPVRLLLSEAFAEDVGSTLSDEVLTSTGPYRGRWQPESPAVMPDPWQQTDPASGQASHRGRAMKLLMEVARRVRQGEISIYRPRAYCTRRQQPPTDGGTLSGVELRESFVAMWSELDENGYLDAALGTEWNDSMGERDEEGDQLLTLRLGRPESWTLRDHRNLEIPALGDNEFYDLVEIFFDLVARPRVARWDDYNHEWNYSEHHRRSGQLVYLWRANTLLEQSCTSLRLADSGEDRGFLVLTPPDDRFVLEESMLEVEAPEAERRRIAHAVSQHRGRGTSRESKRNAVRDLGDVLENRRAAVRTHLGSKDANDLFTIINKFDIRHMQQSQQSNYGEEFLDYVYWTLLATLELIIQLETAGEDPSNCLTPSAD